MQKLCRVSRRSPLLESSPSVKPTSMFLVGRGCLAEGQSSRLQPTPPIRASALGAEPDWGIHLCRGASRCQAGSGGALLRAGWGLAGPCSIHGVCEGGRGGGWTAQALRGPGGFTAQAGDFRTISAGMSCTPLDHGPRRVFDWQGWGAGLTLALRGS